MKDGEKPVCVIEMALLLLCLVLLYQGIVPRMVGDWYTDENYSHGFLIPFISVYLLWTRRHAVQAAAVGAAGSLWGLSTVGVGLAALIVGVAGAEFFLQRSSLILVLIGGVWWLWGPKMLRQTAFPLVFLLFMVPLPYLIYDAVAFPLKLFATRVATAILSLAGVPVLSEGNIIHLAGQTLEVADACSGIRSLVSLVALGVVYAYFTETTTWKRVVLVAFTVPIAVAANALRVTGTGFLTHYISPQAAEGFFHSFSGWLVFVAAFSLLIAVGAGLKLFGKNDT